MRMLKPFSFAWVLSLSLCSLTASAQTWPNKPIKLITSAAPGGIVDIYARRHQPHLHAWPFDGAIELVEQSGEWIQRHRIQDWRYLSTTCSKSSALKVSVQQSFDLDTYKILVKPIMMGNARIEVLESAD